MLDTESPKILICWNKGHSLDVYMKPVLNICLPHPFPLHSHTGFVKFYSQCGKGRNID